MHLQVLSSGSEGNSTLVRAGDLNCLVDAGLGVRSLSERFTAAGVSPRSIDHVLLTHAHLDHARSAGAVAKRHGAMLHCAESNMNHRSLARAARKSTLPIGSHFEIAAETGEGALEVLPVLLPHDCDPTVGFRLRQGERTAVILTDIGRPAPDVGRALAGAHLLMLEFNWDPELMEQSPYPPVLRRRITGGRGHISNDQAAELLEHLAGPELHTLVLAHISKKSNRPELAFETARAALERLGLGHVEVHVASQDEIGPNLRV